MHTDDNLTKIIALGAINHYNQCLLTESKANTTEATTL